MKRIELTVLLPCLNEEANIGECIKKVNSFISRNDIICEVLVSDNNSTDASRKIAKSLGARVVIERKKGYGNVLLKGIKSARGKYIIMADADDSYDLENLEKIYDKLCDNMDIVIGNRFKGGLEKGSMPFINRYIGNPFLSGIAKLLFNSNINDFHCGLRGFNKQRIISLNLNSTGMEFASEMLIKAIINEYNIEEIPTILKKSKYKRIAHLKPFKDGFRHLNTIFNIFFHKEKYIIRRNK